MTEATEHFFGCRTPPTELLLVQRERQTHRHFVQTVLERVVFLPNRFDIVDRNTNGSLISLSDSVQPLLIFDSTAILIQQSAKMIEMGGRHGI